MSLEWYSFVGGFFVGWLVHLAGVKLYFFLRFGVWRLPE